MAAKLICTIPDCSNPHGARGLCSMHYQRFRKHGDPLGGRHIERTLNGAPEAYYRTIALNYEGDDCLIWPYARTLHGYGIMYRGGKAVIASRAICEEVNGPPPTSEHQAAHSCGNGHLGCVTKRHVSWKTPKENQADRLIHGTAPRGERNSQAKLKEADVREIRSLRGKKTQRVIAKQFGISRQMVSDIQRGRKWSWL